MKNKKVMIIISVVLLIVIAIIIGIYKFYSSYMFNEDGTVISNSYNLYYEKLNTLSGDERIKLIEFGVEHNIITRQEADKYLRVCRKNCVN